VGVALYDHRLCSQMANIIRYKLILSLLLLYYIILYYTLGGFMNFFYQAGSRRHVHGKINLIMVWSHSITVDAA